MVRNALVNYVIRFSGFVTALTARRVQHGVGACFICQPDPFARYKTHSPPATFPTTLSLPFFPSLFTVLHSPPSVVPQAAPSSTYSLAAPHPSQSDTTRPVRKMLQRDG
jgi:hypothetical protein